MWIYHLTNEAIEQNIDVSIALFFSHTSMKHIDFYSAIKEEYLSEGKETEKSPFFPASLSLISSIPHFDFLLS